MQREMKLIKLGSMVLVFLSLFAWAYWVIVMGSYILPRLFVDGVWQQLRVVENHAVISSKAKLIYGAMWFVSIVTGSAAFLAAANMLSHFWRGQLSPKDRLNRSFGWASHLSLQWSGTQF
jgi:type VI protein secretion system component VasK